MTATKSWPSVEKRYNLKIPAAVAALYEKQNGETALRGGWRLQSTAELLELNWEDGWLDHKTAGPYVLSLGGLLPLYTNDNSDLIVLHVGGPLDGRLSYCPHDDSSLTLVAHSISTFEEMRTEAGEDELTLNDQYLPGTQAEKNQGIRAANKLRADLGIHEDVDLVFLAHIWTSLGGGHPEMPE